MILKNDMCATDIQTHRIYFVLNPKEIWSDYNSHYKSLTDTDGWKEAKFLSDDGTSLNSDINTLPNNTGGIYVFILKGDVIPTYHHYILYVGRAQCTGDENLRKRITSYFKDDRPKIRQMIDTWGKRLYVRYLSLTDNSTIKGLEEELIRVIIPPCNDVYPKQVRKAMKAAF